MSYIYIRIYIYIDQSAFHALSEYDLEIWKKKLKKIVKTRKQMMKQSYFQHSVSTVTFFPMLAA